MDHDKKLRVLMIDYALPRNKYADGLCIELNKRVDVEILCDSRKEKEFNPKYKARPILYNGGKNKFGAFVSYAKSLIKVIYIIMSGKYDILHIQTFKNEKLETKLYALLKRFYGKLVFTVHNVYPHEETVQIMSNFRKKFFEACDELIVHNEYSKQLLVSELLINEEKIHVIPRGIYVAENISEKKSVEEKKRKINLLFFGKIREYKGLDVLIESLSKLPQDELSKVSVIIAGEQFSGLDKNDYGAMIEAYKLDGVIDYKNRRISDNEKKDLFMSSDACICPYRKIYGSGVLLEAYTYQCPVIVSNIPVFVEDTANGKTGILFESENSESLSVAIKTYINQTEAERNVYRTHIRQLVKTKYNWEKAAQMTLEVYQL